MTQFDRKNKHIRAAWNRFNNTGEMENISLDVVKKFIEERGLTVEKIDEVKFGFSSEIKAIHLKTCAGSALYPRQKIKDVEIYKGKKAPIQDVESFWHSADWFAPAFMLLGDINNALDTCGIKIRESSHLNKIELQKRFESALPLIYTLGNIIPITVQTLTDSVAISKHLPIIKESIFAFYSGMQVAAIAALIPIIEDALSSIIGIEESGSDLITKVNKAINLANSNVIKLHINNVDWIPPEYIDTTVLKTLNERILILETIRHWLINSFYSNTKKYCNHSGFNRHFFAHAKSDIWQNTYNFFRAMGLIQALAFVECFAVKGSKVDIFPPSPDNRTKSFHLEVEACIKIQALKKKMLSKFQIDNQLPHNPTASDDGWLQRAEILSDKMNSEIISKLRDNGWQCHSFTDPIKQGEYITVSAKKRKREVKIALLYSCATSNAVYKELDENCDIILYQGPYYHQNKYAYGIKAQVLPLSAWITPE